MKNLIENPCPECGSHDVERVMYHPLFSFERVAPNRTDCYCPECGYSFIELLDDHGKWVIDQ